MLRIKILFDLVINFTKPPTTNSSSLQVHIIITIRSLILLLLITYARNIIIKLMLAQTHQPFCCFSTMLVIPDRLPKFLQLITCSLLPLVPLLSQLLLLQILSLMASTRHLVVVAAAVPAADNVGVHLRI